MICTCSFVVRGCLAAVLLYEANSAAESCSSTAKASGHSCGQGQRNRLNSHTQADFSEASPTQGRGLMQERWHSNKVVASDKSRLSSSSPPTFPSVDSHGLCGFTRFRHTPGKCSAYNDYALMHKEILAGNQPARYLIATLGSRGQGLGYMTIGISLAFWLAVTSGRALLLDLPLPMNISDVFEPPHGAPDWRFTDQQELKIMLSNLQETNFDYYDFEKNKDCCNATRLSELVFDKGPGVLRLGGNYLDAFSRGDLDIVSHSGSGCSIVRNLLDGAEKWITKGLSFADAGWQSIAERGDAKFVQDSANEWHKQSLDTILHGCAWRYLFRPTAVLDERLSSVRRHFASNAVVMAIHLRAGDAALRNADGDHRLEKMNLPSEEWGNTTVEIATNAALCGAALTNRYVKTTSDATRPCALIFVSDHHASREAVGKLNVGACTVVVPPGMPTHSGFRTNQENALTIWQDFALMGLADLLMVVTKSSYSHSAGLLGTHFGALGDGSFERRFSAEKMCAGSQPRTKDATSDMARYGYVSEYL